MVGVSPDGRGRRHRRRRHVGAAPGRLQINIALTGRFQALMWRQFGAVDPGLDHIGCCPTSVFSAFSNAMARNSGTCGRPH